MAEASGLRWLAKFRMSFEYADVSADPDAPLWANIAREVRASLLELGFVPLGFAHAWLRAGKAHLVHEVLVSEDGLIQAIVGEHEPAIELASLFEDGTIVKTIPLPSKAVWDRLGPGMTFHRRDRYFYEAVDGDLDAVVARHALRVQDWQAKSGSQPLEVRSMPAHFAMRLRAARLINAKLWPQLGMTLALVVVSGVSASHVVALAIRAQYGKNVSLAVVFVLLLLAAFIVIIPLYPILIWRIAPRLVRLLPGPRPPSAAELLERARAIPLRPLPDASEW